MNFRPTSTSLLVRMKTYLRVAKLYGSGRIAINRSGGEQFMIGIIDVGRIFFFKQSSDTE